MRKCLRKCNTSPPKGIILLCLANAGIFLTSACIPDDICITNRVKANTSPLCETVSVRIYLWTASHPFCKISHSTPLLPEHLIKILLKAFFKNVLTFKHHLWKKQTENFLEVPKSLEVSNIVSYTNHMLLENHNENVVFFFFLLFSSPLFYVCWCASQADWNENCACF